MKVLSSVIESHGHGSVRSSVLCLFVFVVFSFTWSKRDAEDNKGVCEYRIGVKGDKTASHFQKLFSICM